MPNRFVCNSNKAPVTVNAITVEGETVKQVNIADVDLTTWVGTAGIAVLADATGYNARRTLAKVLEHQRHTNVSPIA